MTNDGILFISWFFSEFWRFFNSWYIPGTNMTPASFFLTCIIIPLSLKFILSVVAGARIGSEGAVLGIGKDALNRQHSKIESEKTWLRHHFRG